MKEAQKAVDEAKAGATKAQLEYNSANAGFPEAGELENANAEEKDADIAAKKAQTAFEHFSKPWNDILRQHKERFLEKLPRTWRNLAILGWYLYNGSGAMATEHTREVEGEGEKPTKSPYGSAASVPHAPLPKKGTSVDWDGIAGVLASLHQLQVLKPEGDIEEFLEKEWEPVSQDALWAADGVQRTVWEYKGWWIHEFA